MQTSHYSKQRENLLTATITYLIIFPEDMFQFPVLIGNEGKKTKRTNEQIRLFVIFSTEAPLN